MSKDKEAVIRWYKENAPLGRALGYPECCIKAFCLQPPEVLNKRGVNAVDQLRYKAGCINGRFTGFIPCAPHAKLILKHRVPIASLIKNRSKQFPPFPQYAQY